MPITKQDLRQIEAKIQDFKQLDAISGTSLNVLMERVDTDLDYPLKISATFPSADSKLIISNSKISAPDNVSKVAPPVKKQIFTELSSLWIDFQTQAVSNIVDFDIEWPASNSVGQLRYACLTLISSGKIKMLFSPEAPNEIDLINPGALFISGGLPVGYLLLECTSSLGYFKTYGSPSDIIENISIYRFGSGAGGGSGTGDANELIERLKNRLNASTFEYMTPVVYAISEENLTDPSSTAYYNVVSSNYQFDNIGDSVVSVQMLDDEFLAEESEVSDVELIVYWNPSKLDTSATYEISRDGGGNWQPISMTRIGQSDVYRGILEIDDEATNSYIESVGGPSYDIINLDNTNELSRQFSLSNTTTVKKITTNVNIAGSPAGTMYAVVVKDDGFGLPSLDLQDKIAQSKFISISSLTTGSVEFDVRFTAAAGNYHVVIKTDDIYKGAYALLNKIAIESDVTAIMYTLEGLELDLRVKIESGSLDVAIEGFGIFYKNENMVTPVNSEIYRHMERFVGDVDNLDTFTLGFLPDPRLLNVYEINTGQTYRYGAFVVSGNQVIFEPDTFNKPEDVVLEFLQVQGGSFDNSDKNIALLANNHLGSADSSIDLSVAGRGIFLRKPNGELVEAVINNDDQWEFWSI
jgi:hypothetical protein